MNNSKKDTKAVLLLSTLNMYRKGKKVNQGSLQESYGMPSGAVWGRKTPKTTQMVLQKVEAVEWFLYLIGWNPCTMGSRVFSQSISMWEFCAKGSCKGIIIKKNRKVKGSPWRGASQFRTKIRLFSTTSTELLAKCRLSPRNSLPLSPSVMHAGSSSFPATLVALSLFEALL